MRHRKAIGRAAGFSLVEVLVALIVISVGLLGIAKMQALALSNTTSARLRSLAAIQAASLASSMHADRSYWSAVVPGTTTTYSQAAGVASADAALQTAAAAAAAANAADPTQYCVKAATGSAAPCSPVQLAGADLQTWVNDLSTLMPNAQINITCNANPLVCTIALSWTENMVMANQSGTNTAPAAITASTYTLYVQP